MNVVAKGAGAILALVLLSACGQTTAVSPEPSAEQAAPSAEAPLDDGLSAGSAASANNDAVTCMVYLALQRAAVLAGQSDGDADALDAAQRFWRAQAEGEFSAGELAQYYASSTAVLDDTPAAVLAAQAGGCVERASH